MRRLAIRAASSVVDVDRAGLVAAAADTALAGDIDLAAVLALDLGTANFDHRGTRDLDGDVLVARRPRGPRGGTLPPVALVPAGTTPGRPAAAIAATPTRPSHVLLRKWNMSAAYAILVGGCVADLVFHVLGRDAATSVPRLAPAVGRSWLHAVLTRVVRDGATADFGPGNRGSGDIVMRSWDNVGIQARVAVLQVVILEAHRSPVRRWCPEYLTRHGRVRSRRRRHALPIFFVPPRQ